MRRGSFLLVPIASSDEKLPFGILANGVSEVSIWSSLKSPGKDPKARRFKWFPGKRSKGSYNGYDFLDFFRLKIKLLNRMMFMSVKNKMKMTMVKIGLTGARVAKNIMGNPKTMAGKF